jgi:hypothetical protein
MPCPCTQRWLPSENIMSLEKHSAVPGTSPVSAFDICLSSRFPCDAHTNQPAHVSHKTRYAQLPGTTSVRGASHPASKYPLAYPTTAAPEARLFRYALPPGTTPIPRNRTAVSPFREPVAQVCGQNAPESGGRGCDGSFWLVGGVVVLLCILRLLMGLENALTPRFFGREEESGARSLGAG